MLMVTDGDRRQKYDLFQTGRQRGISVNTAERSTCVGQCGIAAAENVQAWICTHDGHPSIGLHLHQHDHQHAEPGEAPLPHTVIRIPGTLLPELKPLVQGLEEQLTA